MTVGKYTRDFFKDLRRDLAGIAGRLDRLIGLADRPRKDDEQPTGPRNAPTEEEYAAIGKVLFALNVLPPATRENEAKKRWYKTLTGWKTVLEVVAIPFAIFYAVVTYFQWRDLQHNFFIEQKSWVKYQVLWPDTPSADFKTKVIITNIGKIPMLTSEVVASIYVFPDAKPALLPDGNHPTYIDQQSFLFPNDNFNYIANLWDEQSMKVRGLSDSELRDVVEGRSYIAVIGIIKYRDELGDHWLRFCDWRNYAPNAFSNAQDCVWMNRSGDGEPPKGRPSDHANPWQK